MQEIRHFLESSTIHGLLYIATTSQKIVRIFWILVVFTGFSVAGFIIFKSFRDWEESPVKTTIETLPITDITFPKVTVCPPKNTYTDLNYHLMMADNMTISIETRNELFNYLTEILNHEYLYLTTKDNLKKLVDNDKNYNIYNGYSSYKTEITPQKPNVSEVTSSSSYGNISTQYYAQDFNKDKVELNLRYSVTIITPQSIRNNPNVTLHIDIEKISMEESNSYTDILYWKRPGEDDDDTIIINQDIFNFHKSFTPVGPGFVLKLWRDISRENVRIQDLDFMPGFRITWHYTGFNVEPMKQKNALKPFIRKHP